MEQRIETLEEEVKLLKNQIRSVLLDIKESLASGDWQLPVKERKAAGPEDEPDQLLNLKGVPDTDSDSKTYADELLTSVTLPGDKDGGTGRKSPAVSEERSFQASVRSGAVSERDCREPGNGKREEQLVSGSRLEPVTLLLLLEWLERSRERLGKEQTDRLVELYLSLNNGLSAEGRQALKLVNGLSGNGEKDRDALSMLPHLLELDNLLRYSSLSPNTLTSLALNLLGKNHNGSEHGLAEKDNG